jgi:hypothetical protein
VCRIHGSTYVRNLARVDDQHLCALALAQALEAGLQGIDGAHRGCAGEGLAELKQEFVTRGDCCDVCLRL